MCPMRLAAAPEGVQDIADVGRQLRKQAAFLFVGRDLGRQRHGQHAVDFLTAPQAGDHGAPARMAQTQPAARTLPVLLLDHQRFQENLIAPCFCRRFRGLSRLGNHVAARPFWRARISGWLAGGRRVVAVADDSDLLGGRVQHAPDALGELSVPDVFDERHELRAQTGIRGREQARGAGGRFRR